MNKEISLSKGWIAKYLQEKKFCDSPVLQILGTKINIVTNDQGDTHYDVYLSDGEKGMWFSSSVLFNKRFSSGKLSVFTVVKIKSLNTVDSFIKDLTIISNGLEIRKMIGNPSPLDSEMEIWLNFFTTKLDMAMMKQLRVNSFKKQCLNTSKKIGELSTGCLEKIRSGEIIKKPLLQVLTLVKVTNAEENCFNYSVELSDGKFSFNRFYTRSTHFNNLVAAGLITELSIIRLEKYEQSDFKSRIKIRNVTVINMGCDVESVIGDPKPVKDGSSKRYAITDRMLNQMLSYSDLSKSILDTSCLSDMQHEVAVSKPILQLITPHTYVGMCSLEISDGLFKIYTETVNSEINELIYSGEFTEACIFRVDEYEVSIVKQEYDTYIQQDRFYDGDMFINDPAESERDHGIENNVTQVHPLRSHDNIYEYRDSPGKKKIPTEISSIRSPSSLAMTQASGKSASRDSLKSAISMKESIRDVNSDKNSKYSERLVDDPSPKGRYDSRNLLSREFITSSPIESKSSRVTTPVPASRKTLKSASKTHLVEGVPQTEV